MKLKRPGLPVLLLIAWFLLLATLVYANLTPVSGYPEGWNSRTVGNAVWYTVSLPAFWLYLNDRFPPMEAVFAWGRMLWVIAFVTALLSGFKAWRIPAYLALIILIGLCLWGGWIGMTVLMIPVRGGL